MLEYRLYVLGVLYIAAVLAGLVLFNSRGCYIHPNTDKSMPLLQSERFYCVGKKFNTVGALAYGDIVVVRYASGGREGEGDDTLHVARVIARPGDTVEIRKGVFFINGKETDCSFGMPRGGRVRYVYPPELPRVTVPKGMLYVLPDDRSEIDMADPRFFVHIGQVRGKLLDSFFSGESYK